MNAFFVVLLACIVAAPAWSGEVSVLSVGAVEPGLRAFGDLVKRETGHDLKIQFNTAPQIARRLAAGETYDILIAPPAAITQAAGQGKVDGDTRVMVGRVGAGIVVRNGGKVPYVGTLEALQRALLEADSIVYNSASTGLYLDQLFTRIGILDTLKPKTTRYPDGASVMEHVRKGTGNEIGFGAITEIRMYEPKGLTLVGPLPRDVQNYTSYDAVLMRAAPAAEPARSVLKLLATPAARTALVAAGVD